MIRAISALLADDDGQGLAEYGLILALVSVLCIGVLGTLQGGIQTALTNAASAL